MFAVPCGWGSGFEERTITSASLAKDGQMLRYVLKDRVPNRGTHEAYMALLESRADLILVARLPSADEMAAARTAHTDFDVRPIAKDAFVFLVHVNNPVTSLTFDQARAIYQGKITNWKELGGPDELIAAYQRDNNSGSQELMAALVMKGAPMINALDMVIPTMNGAVNAIHNHSTGIGYSVYYYVSYMLPDYSIKFLSVNGVQPTPETIANGRYPLTADVYAVTQTKYWSNSATKLRDWLLTDEGRTVIKESGYVLSIKE
jgi:phosphate transport system substrate-binding protein